jgi:hypothetical protein
LSSLLKVLTLLPTSPEHDYRLPLFVARLPPRHAELWTRGCNRSTAAKDGRSPTPEAHGDPWSQRAELKIREPKT